MSLPIAADDKILKSYLPLLLLCKHRSLPWLKHWCLDRMKYFKIQILIVSLVIYDGHCVNKPPSFHSIIYPCPCQCPCHGDWSSACKTHGVRHKKMIKIKSWCRQMPRNSYACYQIKSWSHSEHRINYSLPSDRLSPPITAPRIGKSLNILHRRCHPILSFKGHLFISHLVPLYQKQWECLINSPLIMAPPWLRGPLLICHILRHICQWHIIPPLNQGF